MFKKMRALRPQKPKRKKHRASDNDHQAKALDKKNPGRVEFFYKSPCGRFAVLDEENTGTCYCEYHECIHIDRHPELDGVEFLVASIPATDVFDAQVGVFERSECGKHMEFVPDFGDWRYG